MTGLFPDPRIVYDLTIQEVSVTVRGLNDREQRLQEMNNVRFGTVCATICNVNRTKKSDKVLKWDDFFPGGKKKEDTYQDWQQKFLVYGTAVNEALK